jgi:hypothetical protein
VEEFGTTVSDEQLGNRWGCAEVCSSAGAVNHLGGVLGNMVFLSMTAVLKSAPLRLAF